MNEQVQKLSEYDFIVALDASGSMSTEDCPGGVSRWAYAQETIGAIARELGKLDSDGIDVVVFSGSRVEAFSGVTADKVADVFASRSPMGSTPLAQALTASFELAGKSDKKDFILVLTDGVPDSQEDAKRVILEQANRQQADDELTILFVQVGRDAQATQYLQQLDDQLTGAKFDIVDSKTVAEVELFGSIAELLVAAIND